jgi:two-component system sensor histidine kinase RegB
MNPPRKAVIEPPRHYLKQLTIIRSLLLAFFWCGLIASFWINNLHLPYKEVVIVLGVFSGAYLVTFLRLRQALAVTNTEFFIQLLIDVVCLNALFYFSGGATNPFVSYLLVPVCISAATLPWRFTWFISALCVFAYSILLFFHVKLPIFSVENIHNHSQLSWHILGMWFNFFISAVLITYFVVKMARSLREQEKVLNEMREDELRNEQVIAVATLAAGAAHDINTPLATMMVLLAELRSEYQKDPQLSADLNVLSQQVERCAASLKQMVQDSSAATKGQYKQQNIQIYCNSIIDRWQLMRPEVNFTVHFSGNITQQLISYDSRLDHAIINLLNNAADVSPNNITIEIALDENNFYWKIVDVGHGISADASSILGKAAFSTKEHGLGIGMLLSHTTVKHYGGSVVQSPNTPHGTITTIRLPLQYSA